MKSLRISLGVLLGSALLGGCASTMSPTQMVESSRIQPHQNVSHGASDVQVHYAMGKRHLGEGRFASAREEFLRALALDDGNAEVRNGLATAYVQLGDPRPAIEQLRLAVALAPDASHLQSNLGYALYLEGSYREAATALHRALTLDPENSKARQNWVALQAKVNGGDQLAGRDIETPAPVVDSGNSSSPAGDSGPSVAVVAAAVGPQRSSRTNASQVINIDFQQPSSTPVYLVQFDSGKAPAVTARSLVETNATETVALAPIVTLGEPATPPSRSGRRLAPPEVIVTPLPQADPLVVRRVSLLPSDRPREVPSLLLGTGGARIEVSNGNGVALLATRLTNQFRQLQVEVARITNADHFRYSNTRIYFRDGFATQAIELQRMLPVDAVLVRSEGAQLIGSIDVRIVIGRDLLTQAQVERVRRASPAPIADAFEPSRV